MIQYLFSTLLVISLILIDKLHTQLLNMRYSVRCVLTQYEYVM